MLQAHKVQCARFVKEPLTRRQVVDLLSAYLAIIFTKIRTSANLTGSIDHMQNNTSKNIFTLTTLYFL